MSRPTEFPSEYVDILEAMPDGVVVTDQSGRIVHVNRVFQRLSGYATANLLGSPIESLVPGELRDVHARHREGYTEGGMRVRPMGAGLDITLERADGTRLAVDIALSPLTVNGSSLVLASVRDVSDRRRAEARLRALNEVAQAILTGGSPDDLLHQVASSGARLVDADGAALLVPLAEAVFEVRAVAGEPIEGSRGRVFAGPASLLEEVMATGRSAVRDDASAGDETPNVSSLGRVGPAMLVPLWVRGEPFGVLVVINTPGGRLFDAGDLAEEESFASQAAVALEYSRAHDEVQRLGVLAERERIARELHDTVIQHLFASGMTLQAALRGDPADLGERIHPVVQELDGVIRDIRATIFGLESVAGARGLRARVVEVVMDRARALGIEPDLRFEGPVDAAVADDAHESVVAALREALSRSARPGGRARVSVGVSAADGLVVRVDDAVVWPVELG